MSKRYRDWSPDQSWLFPPAPADWLPEGHLVYFIKDVVRDLDLADFVAHYEKTGQGQPPFHPRMMVTLLLFAYCTGVFSSRKIQARCVTDAAFRVIVADDIPNFRTISDFRKIHLAALSKLFLQALQLCQAAGLVKLGAFALDGSKVKANASRHKAMSYERMCEHETRLKQEIAELLQRAQATDDSEDQQHGTDRSGDELPAELARRESRLKKIQAAKLALEEQARQVAQERADALVAAGKVPDFAVSEALPDPKAQRNFTDPESKIMKTSNKGWDQCGNAQIVTTEDQIIVACDVTNQANDVQQVEPMLAQTVENLATLGVTLPTVASPTIERPELLADAGYYSEANTLTATTAGFDPYLATQRLRHGEQLTDTTDSLDESKLTPKQRMARKLRTKKGRETYSKRKWMVEPVFGQTKACRGFRQFLMRGLEKMQGEWALVCLTHNLLKLFRAQPA